MKFETDKWLIELNDSELDINSRIDVGKFTDKKKEGKEYRIEFQRVYLGNDSQNLMIYGEKEEDFKNLVAPRAFQNKHEFKNGLELLKFQFASIFIKKIYDISGQFSTSRNNIFAPLILYEFFRKVQDKKETLKFIGEIFKNVVKRYPIGYDFNIFEAIDYLFIKYNDLIEKHDYKFLVGVETFSDSGYKTYSVREIYVKKIADNKRPIAIIKSAEVELTSPFKSNIHFTDENNQENVYFLKDERGYKIKEDTIRYNIVLDEIERYGSSDQKEILKFSEEIIDPSRIPEYNRAIAEFVSLNLFFQDELLTRNDNPSINKIARQKQMKFNC